MRVSPATIGLLLNDAVSLQIVSNMRQDQQFSKQIPVVRGAHKYRGQSAGKSVDIEITHSPKLRSRRMASSFFKSVTETTQRVVARIQRRVSRAFTLLF